MTLRVLSALAALVAVLAVAAPAERGSARPAGRGSDYSYGGAPANRTASGVSATLAPVQTPNVTEGHVGGWIGVGGVDAGPGGVAEWLQVGLATFVQDDTSRMYYEVTVA